MPELLSVLEGVPNAKLAERSVEPAGVAPATPLRSEKATVHTSLPTSAALLSHTVFKQRPTSVFLPHMLHETSICIRQVDVGNRAALHTAKVLPGLPGLLFRQSCLLEFHIVGGGGAGWATDAAGESEIRRFWTALVTESWLLGTESPASLIRL